jgi:ankyrin repeat protein
MELILKGCLIAIAVFAFSGPALGTELHDAVKSGDTAGVREIIAGRSDLINAADEAGDTPLHLACHNGQTDLVKVLVDAGAELDLTNERGMTPLRWAIYSQKEDIVKVLLDRGAKTDDIHPMFGGLIDQAFSAACQNNSGPGIVKMLMTHGTAFDGSRVDALGMSRLDWAVHFGNLSMARLALENGADVNMLSQRLGRTPLTAAVQKGHTDLVALLITHGAVVSAVDRDGSPPIRFAVEQGRTTILENLLNHGASVDYIDTTNGWGLMHMAAIGGYQDIVDLLIAHGCPLEATDNLGKTPLEFAARYGNKDAAESLIEHGAVKPEGLIENYGTSPGLSQELPADQAVVWYLNHRGWALKSRNRLMIFDAEEFGVRRSDNPGLVNGFLSPRELRKQSILAVYSCYHGKPGEPAFIHTLTDSLDDMAFVHLSDDAWRGSSNTAYLKEKADTTVSGISVRSIGPTGYMPSLAYLFALDDLTIFYQAFGTDDLEKLKRDFEFLSQFTDTVDVAFLPMPEPGSEEESDVRLFLEHFSTRLVVLLDSNRREHLFPAMADKVAKWGFNTEVFCAENPGDSYRFAPRKMSRP